MILVYLGRWSYGRFWDDNNIFQKMKNDLTTGTWQDDIWCPINIILLCTSDVLTSMSSWNKQFLSIWSISSTHICQWRWNVFLPCSSSAAENANTLQIIPFPSEVCFLLSPLSMQSVIICMTLWNSREHAPGWLSLISFWLESQQYTPHLNILMMVHHAHY